MERVYDVAEDGRRVRDDDRAFAATADVVEPMGDENNVYFTLEGPSFVATVPGLRPVEAGATATVRFPESAIHLFDAETGTAVHNRSLEGLEDETETRPLD